MGDAVKKTTRKASKRAPSIGAIIDELHSTRDTIRVHEAAIKDLSKVKEDLEIQLMGAMDAEGVTKSTGRVGSVSITEVVKPQVEDWDELYEYIRKTKQFHLLERRPSVTGCRELFEMGKAIPGVVPFTKRSVNLRSLK